MRDPKREIDDLIELRQAAAAAGDLQRSYELQGRIDLLRAVRLARPSRKRRAAAARAW